MRIGDSLVMVSGVGVRKATPSFLYLYVKSADATYRRALKAGAASVEEPVDTPYGDRCAMVKDPRATSGRSQPIGQDAEEIVMRGAMSVRVDW